ncbi:MAG: sensor histidine kinase [Actinobacteria bacterium]|nr:MAG: sensor histidine kinase [Actinomycetota bacterium]
MAEANLTSAIPGIWRGMEGQAAGRGSTATSGMRGAIGQYALSGIAALLLLGAAGVYLLRHVGQSEAIRNAKQVAALAGRGIVEPNVTTALLRGKPAAIAKVDGVVRHGILGSRVVRVKLWRPDGTIVYSDEHRLIGSRYPLGSDEQAVLRSGRVDAEVSDLSRPENRFERGYHKLLEVYLPIRAASGERLMFETYDRYSSIAASGRRLWLAFLPPILGTLALLWLVQLPLAWRGARRLREGQAQRETLLRRAIESSELERRRIARDLHDGAVQDLAGVSYSLTATADTLGTEDPAQTEAAVREAAAGTRRTIRELRSLLVDIYPPDLHRTGLEAALRDLVAPLAPRGISADVDVSPELSLSEPTETLLYRCAQEALRNVSSHSAAQNVRVRVQGEDGIARLTVADDGRGFGGAASEGHFGLRLLGDLVREAGGRLEIDSNPGRGTRVCVEAPR